LNPSKKLDVVRGAAQIASIRGMTEVHPDHKGEQVIFAIEYRVRGMLFPQSEPLVIDVRSPQPARFLFSRNSMAGRPAPDGEFFLDVLTRRKPKQAILSFLQELRSSKKMPVRPPFEFLADPRGKIRGLHHVERTGGPEAYEDFASGLQRDLYAAASRILSITRWRIDAAGPHQPIVEMCSGFFSFGSPVFNELPLPENILFEFERDLRVTDEQKADIIRYFENEIDEPLAHRLFREAWTARISSPRSAIMTGVAALEVRIKEAIAELVPGATWLVTNLPSPNVVKILTEGIQGLPAKNSIAGRVLPPPEAVLALLKNAVTLRNSLAHVGKGGIRRSDTQDMLAAIRDTLSLLDYYCGHEWAICHISESTVGQFTGVDVADLKRRINNEDQLLLQAKVKGSFQRSNLPSRLD
jgi:hypothetical protein